MPRLRCKNCNKELSSTGKNETTPWVHTDTGWVKCQRGPGWAEPKNKEDR